MAEIRNLFITGFMGSGKSTFGKLFAEELGFEFCDIDEIIESRTGKSIVDIFNTEGEPYFRDLEKRILSECAQKNSAVISLGGGTLIDPENIFTVKKSGFLVHLTSEPDKLWSRLKASDKRPLLHKSDGTLVRDSKAIEHIELLMKQRQNGYDQADFSIQTERLNEKKIVALIMEFISRMKNQ